MSLRDLKKKSGSEIKVAFFSMLSVCIFILLMIICLDNMFNSRYGNNVFYAQIVNYTVPLIKTTIDDAEDVTLGEPAIRDALFQFTGISIKNPLALLAREVSFFREVPYDIPLELERKIIFKFRPSAFGDSIVLGMGSKDISVESSSLNNEEYGNSNNNADKEISNKVVNVYNPELKKSLNTKKPEVLIYHTDSTDSYVPYGFYNEDGTKNINNIGEELKNELETNYGISVLHDKTDHTPYSTAYTRSRETVEKYLKDYGDFKLVIDLHRDSSVTKDIVTTRFNGKSTAKILLVLSRNNPRFKSNQLTAAKLMKIADKLFPTYCRGILFYENGTEYFNQDKSNNAVQIEVGADVNTFDEAKESAKFLARIIAEYINMKAE